MKRWMPLLMFVLVLLLASMACDLTSKPTPTAPPVIPTKALPTLAPPTIAPPTAAPTATLQPTEAPKPTMPPAATKAPEPTATVAATLGPGSLGKAKVDGAIMVYVPAGKFTMGAVDPYAQEDEKPRHTVNLKAYWIDRFEVTNALYAQCVKDGACKEPVSAESATRKQYYTDPQFADFPVVNVRWDDAKAYCTWGGRRLPTEAEWEKAARGEDGRKYPWGNDEPSANLANYTYLVRDTNKVGSYAKGASPYNAMDMAGNVSEWVSDYYKGEYYAESPADDPLGPATAPPAGQAHVLRGGHWQSDPLALRTSDRGYGMAVDPRGATQVTSASSIGFRCAWSEK